MIEKLEKLYLVLLAVVFGGIVLQAPISVGFGTLLPHFDLWIKSWSEILMVVAVIMVLPILRSRHQTTILQEPLMIGLGVYTAFHIVALAMFDGSLQSTLAGLAIDLRYILFFALLYIAMRLYPDYKSVFIKIGVIGALVVTIFALLQAFFLPADILKYIGYSVHTIAPYLTVDLNHDFIRINSTLRGPNPLGAYMVIVIVLLIAFWRRGSNKTFKHPMIPGIIIAAGALVGLWVSYSRSALIGAGVAAVIVLAATVLARKSRKSWIIGAIIVLVAAVGFVTLSSDTYLSNVILHNNPTEGNNINSDQGHLNSLQDGIARTITQPFGAGIGSTGSASLYTNKPLIIENQYLFIAHEVGWLGLAFFILIFIGVLSRLWQRRADWLSLGIFASGIGLAVIGLFLPVWVDNTVSIVWWGLAALALGARHE